MPMHKALLDQREELDPPRKRYMVIYYGSGGGGGGTSYSAEAQQFFDRLATQPVDARKIIYALLIDTLVAAGIWAQLDVFYIFAAFDQATALTNLKSSSFGGTAVNSPTFLQDRHFVGNGTTSHIATGFTPSTAGGNFVQNSASCGANSGDHSTRQIAAAAWGASLAGLESAFYNAIAAYMTAVGA